MEATFPVLGALPYAAPVKVAAAYQAAEKLIDAAYAAQADADDAQARVRQAEREDQEAIIVAARKGKDHLPTVPRFKVLADDAQAHFRQAVRRAADGVHAYRAALRAAYDDPDVRDPWLAQVLAAYDQTTTDARATYGILTELATRKRQLANLMSDMTGEDDTKPRHQWGNPEALDSEMDKLMADPTWLPAFREALTDLTNPDDNQHDDNEQEDAA
jgi:hypothetical protein